MLGNVVPPTHTQNYQLIGEQAKRARHSQVCSIEKFISDCRYRVIESSFLVPVLFREVFSHPYISFFHLLVNGFSVMGAVATARVPSQKIAQLSLNKSQEDNFYTNT